MNRTFIALVVAGVALLLGPGPAVAHHGAATFDTAQPITIKGTVTEWLWSNPHCILKLDVTEADGTVRNWSVATGNVADASKRGWSRRDFKAGDVVTLTVQPARSGSPVGMISSVILADGREHK